MIILVLVGSLVALPIVLVLAVGAIIFISYKVGITEDDDDDHYDMNNMYRSTKNYKMENKYRSLDDD